MKCNIPKLSIVVVTFNSEKTVENCLSSIYSQEFQDFGLVVVDNGSKDNTLDLVARNYPMVPVIRNNGNLGAARARNQGIDFVGGDWVLTLDPDVTLENGFLPRVRELMRDVALEVGMIQPKLLKTDRKTIYSAGILLASSRRFYDIGRNKPDSLKFSVPGYIFGVCSAAACYRRDMLEEIKEKTGYFDERFFFLAEDVDLAWRAQKKGWRALFSPQAVGYHDGNSSRTPESARKYFCLRNRYLMILKNEDPVFLPRLAFFFIIYDVPRMFFLLFSKNLSVKMLGKMLDFLRDPRKDNFKTQDDHV